MYTYQNGDQQCILHNLGHGDHSASSRCHPLAYDYGALECSYWDMTDTNLSQQDRFSSILDVAL